MSRIVLLDLPEDLAVQLGRVLLEEAHQVTRRHSVADARFAVESEEVESEIAFISGDTPHFLRNLALLREVQPRLPVIVVTRLPDVNLWLDALDGGASDYCAAPFEQVQVRWVLDTVCGNGSPLLEQRAA